MTETREATVPDIGDFTDVPVIEVLVKPGDRVEKDQGLVTLESAKATMEVPAPFAGVVREVKVKENDTVSRGSVIALIEAGDASDRPVSQAKDTSSEKGASTSSLPPLAGEGARRADGEKSSESPSQASPPPQPSPARGRGGQDAPRSPPVPFDAGTVSPDKVPYASPAVRAFARELGVDIARVHGSARGGRITKEDVQAFVKSALAGGAPIAHAATAGGGLQLLPWPQVDFSKYGEIEEKPLSRIKKLSGANLARNWAMIPHVTQHESADITDMEAFRKQLGAENKEVKITPLVFLIKAVVAALKQYPQFNASLDASGEKLVLKKYFHIGIAVDTPDGLVVPVIRDCDRKGLLELAIELGEISRKARDKKLSPNDMSGGCFSISSLGGIGGTSFTPIINAPEVAILGVSRSSMQPVWNGSAFEPRLMLPLSLSYDHRVIDGADAARFAAYLARVLGDLRRLLV
ncbi:MAG TPA: dihydrolipoyllysine-residue acetyltransferase [Rhodanobacteraceae bacterium]|nr:dihydrolipoyllysine-residue acetyltransferase [Rhodanobacteraceae bacterium]